MVRHRVAGGVLAMGCVWLVAGTRAAEQSTPPVAITGELRQWHKVTLTFEGSPLSEFKIAGHDSRIGQVVSNLVDNARSFSPAGGTVRITCRRLRGEVEILVDDEGPGIRPEALDKIFERFYTDRPEQGFGQNSGLGLSISKQIVEAHGGTVRVENRMGGQPSRVLGARFIVRLPAT